MIFFDIPEGIFSIPVVGALVAIGTVILMGQKITKNARKSHDEESAKVLQAAKEEDVILKAKLEARIEKVDAQLKILELSVNKDIGHLKETYSNEIKNLGLKIEALRDEIHSNYSQLVTLLTKLIDSQKD